MDNTKQKSLIIFDCDGVLRSASWEGLFRAYILIIESIGKDYREFFKNVDEFKKWWNPDWKENYKVLGVPDYEAAANIFYKHYEPYVAIFPWVSDALEQLSQKYTLAMATNSSTTSVRSTLGETAKYFSIITGCEHVKKLKPDPEGVNYILKQLNFSPSQAMVIGDMRMDVLAGKNAGTKIGVVNWGLGEWEELLALKPDHEFEKPEDLLRHLA